MFGRNLAAIFTLVVLAVGGIACGEDREGSVERGGDSTSPSTTGTTTSPAPGGPAVATVRVRETEFELDPKNPRIAKAGVVSFQVENAGNIPHALEVEGPRGEVETEAIESGGKATLKADLSEPGSYEWYCPIGNHEARGMKGTITVAGGGSGTSTDDSGTSTDDSGRSGEGSGRSGEDPGRSGEDSGRRGGGGVY